jgi:hypothetical protein
MTPDEFNDWLETEFEVNAERASDLEPDLEPDAANERDALWDEAEPLRRPLDWRGLHPKERWDWFERLWEDVCALRDRYRLAVRSRWWEDAIQLEALAATAAWVARYDAGEWDDPPGKLAMLLELERLQTLLRDGSEPFDPERDRTAFVRHLVELGCQPPPPSAVDWPW